MNREQKWETYSWWSRLFRPMVVCTNCGSTNIDHKPAGRLTCFMCNKDMHWSPDRFKIVRDTRTFSEADHQAFLESTKRDFARGIDSAEHVRDGEMRNDADWYGDIVRATEEFLDAISAARGEKNRVAEELAVMTDRIRATLETMRADGTA